MVLVPDALITYIPQSLTYVVSAPSYIFLPKEVLSVALEKLSKHCMFGMKSSEVVMKSLKELKLAEP